MGAQSIHETPTLNSEAQVNLQRRVEQTQKNHLLIPQW